MTSASGMKSRNSWGSRRNAPAQMHRPAQRSLASRRARPNYSRRQLAVACPESGVADTMVAISAVPELTRGIDIKLNARLSLRGHRNPIASSHRTRPVRIRDPSDHTSTWRLYLRETADGRRQPGF
jgi:hypothetical protein